MPEPLAISDPAVIVRPPLSVELAATDRVPPLIESGSVLVSECTDCVPELIWIVGLMLRLIVTSSLDPGTALPDQLPATVQLFPSADPVQATFESNVRDSRCSISNRLRRAIRHTRGILETRVRTARVPHDVRPQEVVGRGAGASDHRPQTSAPG